MVHSSVHHCSQTLFEWEFKHTTYIPHYPESNGFIERHMETIKNIFFLNVVNPRKALLSWRNTPLDAHSLSPIQLLFHQSQTQNNTQYCNLQRRSQNQHRKLDPHRQISQPNILHPKHTVIIKPRHTIYGPGQL